MRALGLNVELVQPRSEEKPTQAKLPAAE
jgi:hypothetical protein